MTYYAFESSSIPVNGPVGDIKKLISTNTDEPVADENGLYYWQEGHWDYEHVATTIYVLLDHNRFRYAIRLLSVMAYELLKKKRFYRKNGDFPKTYNHPSTLLAIMTEQTKDGHPSGLETYLLEGRSTMWSPFTEDNEPHQPEMNEHGVVPYQDIFIFMATKIYACMLEHTPAYDPALIWENPDAYVIAQNPEANKIVRKYAKDLVLHFAIDREENFAKLVKMGVEKPVHPSKWPPNK